MLVIVGSALCAVAFGGSATAQQSSDAAPLNGVDVVQIEGLLDPPNASLIEDALDDAAARGSTAIVFQLASGGAIDVDVDALIERVQDSPVPVVVWIGPSGANARGGAGEFARAAAWTVISNGAGIGPLEPLLLDKPNAKLARDLPLAEGAAAVVERRLSAQDALEAAVVDDVQPTVGDVIVSLDGMTIATADGPATMSTAEVVTTSAGVRRQPNQEVRFRKLDVVGQIQHTLSTPWVAYFLFVAGLALIVFEFYTASIGLAGGVGAAMLVGAFVGFSHLPVEAWALGVLAVGLLGLTVDVQAGRVGPWTVIGGLALVAGSLSIFGGSSRLDPAWWVIAVVLALTALFMLSAVPAVLRARFSTPTIGREAMLGEMGTAEVDVAPDGVVKVRDALWRARTNRATPISAGAPVRVVAVDGIVLEVEPEQGGARDYRERARRR